MIEEEPGKPDLEQIPETRRKRGREAEPNPSFDPLDTGGEEKKSYSEEKILRKLAKLKKQIKLLSQAGQVAKINQGLSTSSPKSWSKVQTQWPNDLNTSQIHKGLHREIRALAAYLTSEDYPEKWARPKLPEYKRTSDPEVHIVKFLANLEDVTNRKDLWCRMFVRTLRESP